MEPETATVRGSVARIELAARRALDDRAYARQALAWYSGALAFCGDLSVTFRRPLESIVGFVAAMSPQTRWNDQVNWTPKMLAAALASIDAGNTDPAEVAAAIPGQGFRSNKRKGAAILLGAEPLKVLSGDKVRAFYKSILGDDLAVCIDMHAAALAFGADSDEARTLTARRYKTAVSAFIQAAFRLQLAYPALKAELTPTAVQALTWVWWRDNVGERF